MTLMASVVCTACACYATVHAAPRQPHFRLLSEGLGDASRATSILIGGAGNDHILVAGQVRLVDQWRAAVWSDASGMEPVILSDLGFGGTTFDLDGDVDGGDFLLWVVGAVYGGAGRGGPLFPAAWERSAVGGPNQAILLPTLDGGQGEATSVYINEVSSGVTIVGWVDDTSDGPVAAVWTERENGFDLFVLPQLMPGTHSAATDVSTLPNGDLVVVGWIAGDANLDGRAVEWRRTATDWQAPRLLGPASLPWTSVKEIDKCSTKLQECVAAGATGPNTDEPQPTMWLYKADRWWMSEFPTAETHPHGRIHSIATVPGRRRTEILAVGDVLDGTSNTFAYAWNVQPGEPVRMYDLTNVIVTSNEVVLRQAAAVAVRNYGRRTLFFVAGQAETDDADPHAYLLVGGF